MSFYVTLDIYSTIVSNHQNEDDLAVQLVGFLQQFLEIFSELKGKKFYITGESVSSGINVLFLRLTLSEKVCRNVCPMSVEMFSKIFPHFLICCGLLDIANHIFENPGAVDLDLQGIWISDRQYNSVVDLFSC